MCTRVCLWECAWKIRLCVCVFMCGIKREYVYVCVCVCVCVLPCYLYAISPSIEHISFIISCESSCFFEQCYVYQAHLHPPIISLQVTIISQCYLSADLFSHVGRAIPQPGTACYRCCDPVCREATWLWALWHRPVWLVDRWLSRHVGSNELPSSQGRGKVITGSVEMS